MTDRVTDRMLEDAVGALTDAMKNRGEIHPEARFTVGGAYGRTYVQFTGGPLFQTGTEDLAVGTKRECLDAVRAVSRAHHLGRLSFREI
jgi:hypothetical protein